MSVKLKPAKICPCVGCEAVIPRTMLSCRRHWFMAPKPLRDAIWATVGKDWRAWAKNAQQFVRIIAEREGHPCAETEFDALVDAYEASAAKEAG